MMYLAWLAGGVFLGVLLYQIAKALWYEYHWRNTNQYEDV